MAMQQHHFHGEKTNEAEAQSRVTIAFILALVLKRFVDVISH